MRCLIVDDDPDIRESVSSYLARFGIASATVADAQEMRAAFARETYEVVLLDLMLPDEDGLSLCRWLREKSASIGIIMLTAQGDPSSRVVGLEFGADDYVAKPFDPRELVARIKSVGRRAALKPDASLLPQSPVRRFAGWVFDTVKRELKSPDGVLTPLSTAEYRLLLAFVDCPRRVLSRDQIIEMTRGPSVDVSDRSIDIAVSRLRQKLGPLESGAQLINTVRGAGYMFDPDVS
jgi:two-component system OmpR family response regulator